MVKTKLLYNPHAGSKKHIFSGTNPLLLEDIYGLLYKYEIEFDAASIVKPGDARRLAREAAAEGYQRLIVAGGDGTVAEAATGLIDSSTALGILPLGTYMNVARMLSIPFNLESAVMVVKMGNIRSIDVGEILSLEEERVDGKVAREANYFLESVGIGLEADLQKYFSSTHRNRWRAIVQLLKDMRSFYTTPLTIELDGKRTVTSKAHLVMISNSPYSGASLSVAPSSKLNDHTLTITTYKMSKKELLWHMLRLKMARSGFDSYVYKNHPDIHTYTSTSVIVSAKKKRPVDADARIFGETPIAVTVKPSSLKVIVGFPASKKESAMLEKKTYIVP